MNHKSDRGRCVKRASWFAVGLFLLFCSIHVIAEDAGFRVEDAISIRQKTSTIGEVILPFLIENLSVTRALDGSAQFEGLPAVGDPGCPALPAQTVKVLLPPEARVESVSIGFSDVVDRELDGEWDVRPAEPCGNSVGEEVWPEGSQVVNGRDLTVYARDAFYPSAFSGAVIAGEFRGWKVIAIKLNPVRYNPVTRRLLLLESGQLRVQYSRGRTRKRASISTARTVTSSEANDSRRLQVLSMVVNPESATTYESGQKADEPEGTSDSSADFVIMTTTNIQSASTNLAAFVAAKESLGFVVHTVVEGTAEDEEHYLSASTSDGRAEAIKSWLTNHYDSMGIEYVLLIGNPHPTSFYSGYSVPMKMCYPRNSQTTYKNSPTDMYYAELTGDWDMNANGVVGEEADIGTGGIDMMCEVAVGRIPVYDTGATQIGYLDSILAKTIAYESSSDRAWRTNVLGSASFQDDSFVCDGAAMIEKFKDNVCTSNGFPVRRLYQQGTKNASCDSIYTSEYELRGSASGGDTNHHAYHWQNNNYGVVIWWGHGASTWTQVGPNNAADGQLFSYSNASGLDDDHPAFLFPNSCNNGYPETVNNLCVSVLRSGGIGTLSPSRVSWYAVSAWTTTKFAYYSDNASYNYNTAARMIEENESIGDAITWVHANGGLWWSSGSSFMNHLDFNIYGDPSVGLRTGDVGDIPVMVTSSPQHLTNYPGMEASFSVSVSGSAPFFYQWQKDSLDIAAETQAVYTIASVTSEDAGIYCCFVSNEINVATSEVAVLTVLPAAPAPVWVSATNAGGFTAAWGAVAGAAGYRLDVSTNADFSAGGGAGGLFISEVADPGDSYLARYVELYNATEAEIDFDTTTWYLSRQANGGSSWADVQLSGTVAGGETYVIAYNQSIYESTYSDTADLYNSGVSGNGDDGYFLYSGGAHVAGTLEDAYGVLGKDGSGEAWEYTDGQAVRFSSNTTSTATWTASEWSISDADAINMTPSVHTVVNDTASFYVPGYSNLTVTGTSQLVTGLTAETIYYFRVRTVSGGNVSTNSSVGSVTTLASGTPPVMDAIPDQVTGVGADFEYTVTATEEDGDSCIFACTSAVNEATWAVDTNGYFLFSPTASEVATNLFIFTATDKDGTSAPANLSIRINAQAATNAFEEWVQDQGRDPGSIDFSVNADFDGDGATTEEEFVADTDPTASNSVLALDGDYFIASTVGDSTGQIRFSFPASTSRFYQLEYCTDLTNHITGASLAERGAPGPDGMMTITNDSTGTWYGVIRVFLEEP